MKKLNIALIGLALLFVACASTPTINWAPRGGETTDMALRSDSDASVYLAIKAVDGETQANPWTFFEIPTSKGRKPKVLGENTDVNIVSIEVGVDYELELGFYEAKGLLENGPLWNSSKPTIILKALEPGTEYVMKLSRRSQVNIGKKIPQGELNVATLSLRGGKGLFNNKAIQQWRIYVKSDSGSNSINSKNKVYLVEEEEPSGLFS